MLPSGHVSSTQSSGAPDVERLKQALLDGGFEIYRVDGACIVLAERVRMHLMESAVTLDSTDALRVSVCVRAQRTDYPGDNAAMMLERVRTAMRESIAERGFAESAAGTRDITHPAEPGTVLDVWHEVTFSKVVDEDGLNEYLRWALSLPRCVSS